MEGNYPFDMPSTTKNSVLKDRANLAGMFAAVEDGGCQGYLYELARIPNVQDYDFTKCHPRYWSELCKGQCHRLVFDLVHNNHPFIYICGGNGGLCKWDYLATVPPPFDGCHMVYLMFGHKRSGERCIIRMSRASVMVGVTKLSSIESTIVLQIDSLGGKTMYVGKLSAQRVWSTAEVEKMLHKVLAMKGKISVRQGFTLLSGIGQEGGIPCTLWNPMSYVHQRVGKKQKIDMTAPNRACALFEPVEEQYVTANGLEAVPFLDMEPLLAGSSDEESDDSAAESEPVQAEELDLDD